MTDVLVTKLHIPQPRAAFVDRRRLVAKLHSGLERKLTVVCAPAGFGKTTLLSRWAMTADVRVAWLSLDVADNDPVRFVRHFVAALERSNLELGKRLSESLQAIDRSNVEPVLRALVNVLIDESSPFGLVLDDYHVIKSTPIHDAMTFLIDHSPPAMRLILASRADPPLPLARLRAHGQLLEVRASDLRFTSEEAIAFLNDEMELQLTREQVLALEARTEGWIAGLQLAALALQDVSDAASFIETFSGSHRYIADFLVEDVLEKQPEDIQDFLLQTSVLERFTGPLCDVVTSGRGSASTIRMLENASLFLVPLDAQRHWYRYHHVFAEVLQSRLRQVQRDSIPELHRRACTWFEREGMLADAAEHAMSAGEMEWAARIVEVLAETLWPRGEIDSVLGWLERLPAEVVDDHPRLLLLRAWTHFLRRSYAASEVAASLDEAERVLHRPMPDGGAVPGHPQTDADHLQGILACVRAAVASAREDAPSTLAHAREARAHLPHGKTQWGTVLALSEGLAHDALGDARAADAALTEAIALGNSVPNGYLTHVATMNLARVRLVRGQLRSAADLSERTLGMAGQESTGRSPIASYPHVVLAKLHYEWNDLVVAARHLEIAIERAHADEHLRALLDGWLARARVAFARGDVDGTHSALQRAEQVPLPFAPSLAAAHRARLALRLGDHEEASRWAGDNGVRPDDALDYGSEYAHMVLARVLVAAGRFDDALQLQERLLHAAKAGGREGSVIELLVQRAVSLKERGDSLEAQGAIERAVRMAEPEGYIRLFTDEGEPMVTLLQDALRASVASSYVADVLASFPGSSAPVRSDVGAGLFTDRELSVLRLMAARSSDKEIAKALSLSVSTVKWYSNRIFEKLDVHRRGDAVTRAKALGVL